MVNAKLKHMQYTQCNIFYVELVTEVLRFRKTHEAFLSRRNERLI